MNQKFTRTLGMLALTAVLSPLTSCNKDLDQVPSYSANAEVVYASAASAEQVLARLYATFAVSGQTGPAGSPDISGIDEGFSNYLRQYWQIQEVTTDEAVIGWNDGNLPFLNTLQWNADNEFVRATYEPHLLRNSLVQRVYAPNNRHQDVQPWRERGRRQPDSSLPRRSPAVTGAVLHARNRPFRWRSICPTKPANSVLIRLTTPGSRIITTWSRS